jgi:hypothetical protein
MRSTISSLCLGAFIASTNAIGLEKRMEQLEPIPAPLNFVTMDQDEK